MLNNVMPSFPVVAYSFLVVRHVKVGLLQWIVNPPCQWLREVEILIECLDSDRVRSDVLCIVCPRLLTISCTQAAVHSEMSATPLQRPREVEISSIVLPHASSEIDINNNLPYQHARAYTELWLKSNAASERKSSLIIFKKSKSNYNCYCAPAGYLVFVCLFVK